MMLHFGHAATGTPQGFCALRRPPIPLQRRSLLQECWPGDETWQRRKQAKQQLYSSVGAGLGRAAGFSAGLPHAGAAGFTEGGAGAAACAPDGAAACCGRARGGCAGPVRAPGGCARGPLCTSGAGGPSCRAAGSRAAASSGTHACGFVVGRYSPCQHLCAEWQGRAFTLQV